MNSVPLQPLFAVAACFPEIWELTPPLGASCGLSYRCLRAFCRSHLNRAAGLRFGFGVWGSVGVGNRGQESRLEMGSGVKRWAPIRLTDLQRERDRDRGRSVALACMCVRGRSVLHGLLRSICCFAGGRTAYWSWEGGSAHREARKHLTLSPHPTP